MSHPARLSHAVLRSYDVKRLTDWYVEVLEGHVIFEDFGMGFMTYDEEHHRLGIVPATGTPGPDDATKAGLVHLAFAWNTLDELVETYARLRDARIYPRITIDHGLTMSFYYQDPDGNGVELVTDLVSPAEATAMMHSPPYQNNPVGLLLDAEELLAGVRAGEITAGDAHCRLQRRDRRCPDRAGRVRTTPVDDGRGVRRAVRGQTRRSGLTPTLRRSRTGRSTSMAHAVDDRQRDAERATEPLVVVSCDSHIGPTFDDLRPYCDAAHVEAFDEYRRGYEEMLRAVEESGQPFYGGTGNDSEEADAGNRALRVSVRALSAHGRSSRHGRAAARHGSRRRCRRRDLPRQHQHATDPVRPEWTRLLLRPESRRRGDGRRGVAHLQPVAGRRRGDGSGPPHRVGAHPGVGRRPGPSEKWSGRPKQGCGA